MLCEERLERFIEPSFVPTVETVPQMGDFIRRIAFFSSLPYSQCPSQLGTRLMLILPTTKSIGYQGRWQGNGIRTSSLKCSGLLRHKIQFSIKTGRCKSNHRRSTALQNLLRVVHRLLHLACALLHDFLHLLASLVQIVRPRSFVQLH